MVALAARSGPPPSALLLLLLLLVDLRELEMVWMWQVADLVWRRVVPVEESRRAEQGFAEVVGKLWRRS